MAAAAIIDEFVVIEYLLVTALFALCVIVIMVYDIVRRLPAPPPHRFRIHQLDPRSNTRMPITGIKPGSTGSFDFSTIPTGSVLPASVIPVWTSSDTTNVSLTPSADGRTVAAAVLATATITTFTLTVTATLADGSTPTGSAPVPVLQPEPTGFTINQTA